MQKMILYVDANLRAWVHHFFLLFPVWFVGGFLSCEFVSEREKKKRKKEREILFFSFLFPPP